MSAVRSHRSHRWRAVAAVALVAVIGAGGMLLVLGRGGDGGGRDVPHPLFDDVEQLTPTALPEGWRRCGGGRSVREEATAEWWAQTFGPMRGGECLPLVTVIQVPPEDRVRIPDDATNGGIGEEPGRTGAKHWSTGARSRGLYTTASGGLQRLVVEGCCGPEATGPAFDLVAEAARDATRERAPARCTAPHSDLDEESFLDNYFARHQRAADADDCPVRGDIVSWRTEGPDHHCWPNVTFLTVGSPVGALITDSGARTYVRDRRGQLRSGEGPDPRLDLVAVLPETALDTGFRLRGSELWIDEGADEHVYVVSEDNVEAWPIDREQRGCA